MSRPKRQIVYALPGTDRADALARLQPDINRLLTFANLGQRGEPGAPPFAIEAHRVLSLFSEGRAHSVRWSERAFFALMHLESNVRSGDYHLPHCRECQKWMLVKNSGRQVCNACRKKLAAKKEAKRRSAERKEQKRALALVRRRI